jgi:hypothetical protein
MNWSFGMTKNPDTLRDTKRLMAALGRMPPKPHDEMKLGNTTAKEAKSPRQKRRDAAAKPKTS